MDTSATVADVRARRMTNFRWVICGLLFLATTVNYMDRQVLSLTWKDFIAPEFHWTDTDYGNIAAVFSFVYAIANLFAGRFIDWMGTKKGYLWAIFYGRQAHASMRSAVGPRSARSVSAAPRRWFRQAVHWPLQ